MSNASDAIDKFAVARDKLRRVPNSQEVALVEDEKVRMTLRTYESMARHVAVLERQVRNTNANRALLGAIEQAMDSHHPSNEVQLLRGRDELEITDLGHDVLNAIEHHMGDLA